MSADDLELEVRETFYDSVVEMFEFDLSVLPNVTGTTKFYFTNFVIPKEGSEKHKMKRSQRNP